MRRALLVTSMVFAVSGCAVYGEYWSRPGATEAQFEAAAANCENAAVARFPPMTFGAPGFFRTSNEYCMPTAGGLNCNLIHSGYLPQARSDADTNAVPRANAFEACMVAGGWRPGYQAYGEVFTPPVRDTDRALGQALTDCESRFKRTAENAARFHQCVMTRARELSGPRPPA
jgi:hypothetical protein